MPALPLRPDDRVARLYVLDFGLFRVHADGREIGIPGFLIETEGGIRILVDSGFPAAYASDPARAAAEDGLSGFGEIVRLGPENLPGGQLARLGLAPADIDLVVLTHSDIDHIGSLGLFEGRPVMIGAAELALPRPRWFGSAGRQVAWPACDWLPVAEDTALCDGLSVLCTPGHSPGHLSLLVALPSGSRVLIVGDAISRPSEPDEGMKGSWDEDLALRTARRLIALAEDLPAFLVYGHGPAQWPALPKAPVPLDPGRAG